MKLTSLLSATFLSTVFAEEYGRGAIKYYWVAHNPDEPSVDAKRFGLTDDGYFALNTGNELRTFTGQDSSSTTFYQIASESYLFPAVATDRSILTGEEKDHTLPHLVRRHDQGFFVCQDDSKLYVSKPTSCQEAVNVSVSLEHPYPAYTYGPDPDRGYGSSGSGPVVYPGYTVYEWNP